MSYLSHSAHITCVQSTVHASVLTAAAALAAVAVSLSESASVSDVVSIIRYDTIGEFNVDWKAEYSALSIAHVARKKENKTTNASAPLIQYRLRSVKSTDDCRLHSDAQITGNASLSIRNG